MARFVYADPHWGHKNIIKYENRPFKSVEEMDSQLIQYWNETVTDEDTVFVLGDVSFYGKEKTRNVIKQLRGKKILVMGNHDKEKSKNSSADWWLDAGFDSVNEYPIIVDNYLILSHEPVYMNEYMPYINIHGHLHSKTFASDKYINVGVENIDYRPVPLDELIAEYIQNEE